jgi:hypothetical protein
LPAKHAIAIAREKQFGGGSIMDGKTDPSSFLRITDGITDAKNVRRNEPLRGFVGPPNNIRTVSFYFECFHAEINAIFFYGKLPSHDTSSETGGAARSAVC